MRVQTYRPKIQNGPVSKRRSRTSGSKVTDRRVSTRRSSRGRNNQEQPGQDGGRPRGGNFLWMLMVIGAVVGGGLIFALRSQINAHQLSQAEAQLRSELDEIANRQRYEVQQQQRALSPRESDRTARQNGLVQPRLNQPDLKISPAAGTRTPSSPSAKAKKDHAKESAKERQPARTMPHR